MQPGEQVIFELKRHPIGLFISYILTGIILIALGTIAFVVAPNSITGSSRAQVVGISGGVFVLFALLCLLFNLVTTVVYWGNRWVLSSDSITQISQTGLFHKETSQLDLTSLEDVTADQKGIMAHMFNYGVLKAETAGHRSKFVFNFCPNPTHYAQQILAANEKLQQTKTMQPQPPVNPYQS
jgi:uncharacterized membrane protein YdbT with pleckstrin-like domain